MTECFGLNKIRFVTVNVETHIASIKMDYDVWLGGSLAHQHLCLFDGVSGRQIFLRADFVDRNKHGGIDGVRDVDEGAGDALHARDAVFFKIWCGCSVGRVLDFGTIAGERHL